MCRRRALDHDRLRPSIALVLAIVLAACGTSDTGPAGAEPVPIAGSTSPTEPITTARPTSTPVTTPTATAAPSTTSPPDTTTEIEAPPTVPVIAALPPTTLVPLATTEVEATLPPPESVGEGTGMLPETPTGFAPVLAIDQHGRREINHQREQERHDLFCQNNGARVCV